VQPMASLMENVLSLEQEADALVAAAHAEAKDIEKQAETDLRARKEAIASETAHRIEEYKASAEARCREDLARAEREHEAATATLQTLDRKAISRQAENVVARFKEI
jgi:hypothetical protein